MRMHLGETNILICILNKADCPPTADRPRPTHWRTDGQRRGREEENPSLPGCFKEGHWSSPASEADWSAYSISPPALSPSDSHESGASSSASLGHQLANSKSWNFSVFLITCAYSSQSIYLPY